MLANLWPIVIRRYKPVLSVPTWMYRTILFRQALQFNFTILREIPVINVDTRLDEFVF